MLALKFVKKLPVILPYLGIHHFNLLAVRPNGPYNGIFSVWCHLSEPFGVQSRAVRTHPYEVIQTLYSQAKTGCNIMLRAFNHLRGTAYAVNQPSVAFRDRYNGVKLPAGVYNVMNDGFSRDFHQNLVGQTGRSRPRLYYGPHL